MEKVHILLSTGRSENNTRVEGVYNDIKDAKKKMRELFNSSKKFWEDLDKSNFSEVRVDCFDTYAEAYGIDQNLEEVGMSWAIETYEIQ